MLSLDDADLIRRDPSIPGLPVLLDSDALLASLQPYLPDVEGPVETLYLRYKPATSCLVGYRVRRRGETTLLYARAHRRGDSPKIRDEEKATRARLQTPIVLSELNTVVRLFPQDLELRVLQRLAEPHSRQDLLRRLLPTRPEFWDATVRCLRYKPERRYVGELLVNDRQVATLRVLSKHDYRAAQRGPERLQSRGSLRLPDRLGRRSRHCALVYEWLDGYPLMDALTNSDNAEATLQRLGAALAELHCQKSRSSRVVTPHEKARSVIHLAEALSDLCPTMTRRINRLAGLIARRVTEARPAVRTIHGDFYASQVLLVDDAIGFIDLDQAARGDPAVDLGNFIAHLYGQSLTSGQEAAHVGSMADAICAGYRETASKDVPRRRVDLYTAVGLLHVAPHFFRCRDPDWVNMIDRTLTLAEQALRHRHLSPNQPRAVFMPQSRSRPAEAIVLDPFRLREDPRMSFLASAFDRDEVLRRLEPLIETQPDLRLPMRIEAIRAVRYKPHSRCLIEYDLACYGADGGPRSVTIMGKARSRGSVDSTYRLMKQLVQNGFGDESEDQVSVPGVFGTIGPWRMWLQRKVHGTVATKLLPQPSGDQLARQIAAALMKLHTAGVPAQRRHTIKEELSTLDDRLIEVARLHPAWRDRLSRIREACHRLARAVRQLRLTPIHRDFYPDQVLAAGARLYLLDFDLYCEGDPTLDLGNFCGHLVEQGLRTLGSPSALAECEAFLVDHYQALTGSNVQSAVDAYTTLTLVRHIAISTRIPERRRLTGELIDLCEQRLEIGRRGRVVV